MESDGNRDAVREQLHEAERGEVVSWVVYPPTPAWWAVGFGAWAALLALAIGLLGGLALALAELASIAVMLVVIAWDRRRRGTYPSGRPPRELVGAIWRMLLGAVAVAGAAWLVGEQVGVWVAAPLAGVGSWAVVAWYEHEYAVVAARIRQRLT